jgi:hypothetical protein
MVCLSLPSSPVLLSICIHTGEWSLHVPSGVTLKPLETSKVYCQSFSAGTYHLSKRVLVVLTPPPVDGPVLVYYCSCPSCSRLSSTSPRSPMTWPRRELPILGYAAGPCFVHRVFCLLPCSSPLLLSLFYPVLLEACCSSQAFPPVAPVRKHLAMPSSSDPHSSFTLMKPASSSTIF